MDINEAFAFSVISTGKVISLLNVNNDRTSSELNDELLVLMTMDLKPPSIKYEIYIAVFYAKYWRDVVVELTKNQTLKFPNKLNA